MAVHFECTTRTSLPMPELFDRARSIDGHKDSHKDSMARSRKEAAGGVTSGLISLSEEVTWRGWHFGVPLRMTSRVTEMDPPDFFVDEQVKGPFRRFRHVHEFSADSAGTTMVDRIEFEAPFGVVGRLVEKLALARHLKNLFSSGTATWPGTSSASSYPTSYRAKSAHRQHGDNSPKRIQRHSAETWNDPSNDI